MKTLELITHAENKISIKDGTHSIDINDSKWDPLFKFLLDTTDYVYFYGFGVVVADDELSKDVHFVSEEVLVNENYNRILVRIKSFNLLKRSLLRNIWICYESSVLVFLMNKSDQNALVEANYKNTLIKNCFTHIEGYFTVYSAMDEDVLWVESDLNFSKASCLI